MSLFKLITWWSGQVSDSNQNLDGAVRPILCVSRFNSFDSATDTVERDTIFVGTSSGMLSVYQPSDVYYVTGNRSPTDVILECQLNEPIIDIKCGKFAMYESLYYCAVKVDCGLIYTYCLFNPGPRVTSTPLQFFILDRSFVTASHLPRDWPSMVSNYREINLCGLYKGIHPQIPIRQTVSINRGIRVQVEQCPLQPVQGQLWSYQIKGVLLCQPLGQQRPAILRAGRNRLSRCTTRGTVFTLRNAVLESHRLLCRGSDAQRCLGVLQVPGPHHSHRRPSLRSHLVVLCGGVCAGNGDAPTDQVSAAVDDCRDDGTGNSISAAAFHLFRSTESVIVILGEHNLICLTDGGVIKFIKKLDYEAVTFHSFVIGYYFGKWE